MITSMYTILLVCLQCHLICYYCCADDKEMLECMTALQQAVDPKQLCQLVTSSLDKSNILLSKIVTAMDGEH